VPLQSSSPSYQIYFLCSQNFYHNPHILETWFQHHPHLQYCFDHVTECMIV